MLQNLLRTLNSFSKTTALLICCCCLGCGNGEKEIDDPDRPDRPDGDEYEDIEVVDGKVRFYLSESENGIRRPMGVGERVWNESKVTVNGKPYAIATDENDRRYIDVAASNAGTYNATLTTTESGSWYDTSVYTDVKLPYSQFWTTTAQALQSYPMYGSYTKENGNKLIFGTSFGYMNYMQKLAKEYPDVKFEHATGYKTAPNMTNYNIRFYEGRYLAGMLAGGATKSNIIGYVAPFPIPEVLQGINAFTLGAKSVNPNIQVKVIWTNAWYDPPKDTDSAKTLLGQGADILTQHTNTSAVASAAEAAGKMVIPYNSDMKSVAPNAQIAALVLNWGPYYAKKIQQMIDGKWDPTPVWMHYKDGAMSLEGVRTDKIPADIVKKMEEVKAKIESGEFHPFTGPIKTNDGKEAAKAGEVLKDDQLQTMNYYVDGVIGKVPN